MAAPGTLALDGGDPRLSVGGGIGQHSYTRPQMRKLHDHTVSFEEYNYYAELTREREETAYKAGAATEKTGILATIFPSKSYKHQPTSTQTAVDESGSGSDNEKSLSRPDQHLPISDEEWVNASRALRTATWSAVFYLITTDILGPSAIPFAIGTLGWGLGVALYTVFGFLAGYSGWLMWKIFLGLDSDQFPLKTYGDLMFRLFGRPARHMLNILQTIQLLCNVGIIIISNGESLSQVAKFNLCYAICCFIWAICGFFIGQVRTLQNYGWLANAAVWMNLLVIFMSMGVFAHTTPNYSAAFSQSSGAAISGPGGYLVGQLPDGSYPPVTHFAGLPDPNNFGGSINGLMQGVYAYGGAMLFTEFMSEMRRPRDFIKSLFCATVLIYAAYMLYGLFSYAYQGQYLISVAYQGISNYAWQTVCNMFSVISGLISAGLYGNIGIKVLYNNILVDFFRAPPLTSKKGKWLWIGIVPIYWSIAFVIAASIPAFFQLTSLVAAICILQFTYTLPPIMAIGYAIHKNAIRSNEGFDPSTGQVTRFDNGISRWVRGFVAGGPVQIAINIWHIIYAGGALATAGLGAWAAITALIAAFQVPELNAFTCTSPLGPAPSS